jgi:hypothetical protein
MQQQRFINNSNQLNMFRAMISPILKNTLDCVYSLWYNAPTMLPTGSLDASASRLPAGNIVGALYHNL